VLLALRDTLLAFLVAFELPRPRRLTARTRLASRMSRVNIMPAPHAAHPTRCVGGNSPTRDVNTCGPIGAALLMTGCAQVHNVVGDDVINGIEQFVIGGWCDGRAH
jgi:hypothetical protein